MAGRAQKIFATILVTTAIALVIGRGLRTLAQSTGDVATITGFSIPELDENGKVKWKVLGDLAKFNTAGGPADITRVRMEMYKDSQVDMVLTSPQCFYDREKREAETDAPVQITGKNLYITGTGFFWSGTNNLFVIRNHAHVFVANQKTSSTNSAAQVQPNQETTK